MPVNLIQLKLTTGVHREHKTDTAEEHCSIIKRKQGFVTL